VPVNTFLKRRPQKLSDNDANVLIPTQAVVARPSHEMLIQRKLPCRVSSRSMKTGRTRVVVLLSFTIAWCGHKIVRTVIARRDLYFYAFDPTMIICSIKVLYSARKAYNIHICQRTTHTCFSWSTCSLCCLLTVENSNTTFFFATTAIYVDTKRPPAGVKARHRPKRPRKILTLQVTRMKILSAILPVTRNTGRNYMSSRTNRSARTMTSAARKTILRFSRMTTFTVEGICKTACLSQSKGLDIHGGLITYRPDSKTI
ncbi:unnamed protein product, partial [Trichogramma brassicae]